jgi:hypothetical protein
MADLTSETIQKVLDISNPALHQVKDAHGIDTMYSTKPLHQVKATPPEEPQAVSVATLAGFADLINAKLEGENFPENFLVHVENEQTVVLKARESDEFGRRLQLIKAQPVPFERFKFGQWVDQESFVIALASLFADSEDKTYVLSTASSLTNDASSLSEDDGFTQKVNIKAGLSHKTSTTLKSRVKLAPFRTFPELEQPVSEFVFRAKCDGEGRPHLMLVEADGGRWKIDAIATIRKAVESHNLNIPVIA